MGRIQASWQIFKFSVGFVKSEKKLLFYPIITFFIQLVLMLLTVGLIALITYNTYEKLGGASGIASEIANTNSNAINDANQIVNSYSEKILPSLFTTENNILIFIVLILLFSMLLVGNLFSIAVINSVLQKIETKEIDIKLALKNTFSNIFHIAGWTLFNFIIGSIINYIVRALERIPLLSFIVSMILNAAWVTFTFFALPILAVKKYNPIKTLKLSTNLIRRKFGVNVISLGGLGIVNFLWFLSVLGLGGLLFHDTENFSLHSFITQLNLIIFFAYFISSLCFIILFSLVYRATLFMYCAKDILPEGINTDEINGVISYRKRSGRS